MLSEHFHCHNNPFCPTLYAPPSSALPANDLSPISLVLPFWEVCIFGILQHGVFPDEFLSLSDVHRSVPRNIVNEIYSRNGHLQRFIKKKKFRATEMPPHNVLLLHYLLAAVEYRGKFQVYQQ